MKPSDTPRSSPLLDPGWVEWNQTKWNVDIRPIGIGSPEKTGARLTGYLYLRNKRVVLPPLNPYLPLALVFTGTNKRERLTRQWHDIASELIRELQTLRFHNTLSLPPGISDSRVFDWQGYATTRGYTYVAELPFADSASAQSIRKNIRKAEERGLRAERSEDWTAIAHCLHDTAHRQKFNYRIQVKDLVNGQRLMGNDFFRGYIVLNSGGEVVSGGVRLNLMGAAAIDLLQGTTTSGLADGANQLMYSYTMRDLQSAGAVAFDFCGANIPSIARAKSEWGAPLVEFIRLHSTTAVLRQVARRNQALNAGAKAIHQLIRKRV